MKARRKYRRAFPLRAFLLFLAVSAAVVVSFILWGDEINGWMNDAIASTDGNRFFVALVLLRFSGARPSSEQAGSLKSS